MAGGNPRKEVITPCAWRLVLAAIAVGLIAGVVIGILVGG
jgi:hypothetical protein